MAFVCTSPPLEEEEERLLPSTGEIKAELRVNRARLTTTLTSTKRAVSTEPNVPVRGVNVREGILFNISLSRMSDCTEQRVRRLVGSSFFSH